MLMKNIFQRYNEYKNVIIYLLRFITLYIIFSLFYAYYLKSYNNQPDIFTLFVAESVQKIYEILGIHSSIEPLNTSGLKLIINGKYVARIVEGCSAMSIIILFVVFILSFGKLKSKNYMFILSGILSIFVFNILRIAFLGYVLYAFPEYQDFLHRVLFPALIYGWIVLLWIFYILKIYETE